MVYTQRLPLLALAALLMFFTTDSAIGSQSGHQPTSEVPDAAWLLENFAAAVALRDINPDPMYKCLTTTRVDLDPTVPSATYRWSLNVDGEEQQRHPLIQFTGGPTPDQVYAVVNGDTSHTTTSRVLYTDYEACVIQESHFIGNQCTLWVLVEYIDTFTQECLKKHAEMCGEGISLYDKDQCGGPQP